ncbi:MAG TPA: DUF6326 family protein [Gemmatimonadales bacterium]|nr:DUF6326 family protein [Gemmatimonadales bacterium]
MSSHPLDDQKVPTRIKLAALWTSVMFCYVYGDYFELYRPGKLQQMLDGQLAIGPVSQGMLLGTGVMMALPALMVVLSVTLPAAAARWLNIVTGLIYAGIMTTILINGAWYFYMLYAAIEVTLTLTVIWTAWRWPRRPAEG